MDADLVLHNATCITMDATRPEASAIAIRGERIVWVGDQKERHDWIGPKTIVVDLQGAYVYPGFIDSHAHICYSGQRKLFQLDLSYAKDKKQAVELVQKKAATLKKGEWLIGYGWDEECWPEKSYLRAQELDIASPNNPVLLWRVDTHLASVNSLAMKMAGITKETEEPQGGQGGIIERDSQGAPTGILIEKAVALVYPFLPSDTEEETSRCIIYFLQEAVQKGITMIHEPSLSDMEYEVFTSLATKNALPLRVYGMVQMPSTLGQKMLERGPHIVNPFFEVRCLKFFMDGAMGARSAALLAPYSDQKENSGLLIWNREELLPLLKQAKEQKFQVASHAIGDRAVQFTLDAYEAVSANRSRWRIEHAQLTSRKEIARFKALGVIASMQPMHIVTDMPWFEARVGKSRLEEGGFALKSLLESGVVLAGGSDAPIADINPLLGIYAAITRQDFAGNPPLCWYPKERISRWEALSLYTMNGAYAAFRENDLGSITCGKLADLVILPENLLTCNPKALLSMQVLYTIVNGKIAYQLS